MKDGASQRDRNNPALEAGYIDVDEMRMEDLLSFAADFSRLLRFTNLKNQADGDWQAFFASDEAVIFALIETLDLQKTESDFYQFMKAAPWGMSRKKFLSQGEAWKRVPNLRLAKRIDDWYRQLKRPASEAGATMLERIRREIQNDLGRARQELKVFLSQYHEAVSPALQRGFDPDWLEAAAAPSVPAPSETYGAIEGFLKSNFYVFYNAALSLKSDAKRLMPLSLKSQAHPPAIGLFIAFLQLFKRAQGRLNRFQQRHLDFYYNDILKIQARPRVPDSTYLIFHPTAEGRSILIEKGTAFTAGVDENHRDILYTADTDLVVNRAEITDLLTLFLARNPRSSPENSMGYVSAVKESAIPVLEAEAAPLGARPAWPLFGAPRSDAQQGPYRDARFGFALASPVLFLKEGEREIELSIRMSAPLSEAKPSETEQTLNAVLETMLTKLRQTDGLNDAPTEGEKQAFFFKVFRPMFRIALTTETAWLTVDDYLPSGQWLDPNCPPDVLKLRLSLPAEADPIAAYNPEIHGGGFDTGLPLLRLRLNPQTYLFPYSLLMPFIVKEIKIEVSVRGARDLLLYNQLGRLDPKGPFNPFGPLPTPGAYLIVGHAEMARKRVTGFEARIEWGDLPRDKDGFSAYYGAYPETYDNTAFKVGLTTLSGGQWMPTAADARRETELFQTQGCGAERGATGPIDPRRRLSCDAIVDFYHPLTGPGAEKPFAYTPEIKGGFFKFTLSAPETAFGHKVYPNVLTQVLTANARLKLPKLFKPVPNPPYTPLINALSIDYKAVATLNMKHGGAQKNDFKERFFHLHPFGHEWVSPESARHVHLLPRYLPAGNLFIGLSEAPAAGVLTLFFHLREDTAPETGTAPSAFEWSYLSSNRWHRLEAGKVLSDSTGGFLTSGIVTLKIPADMNLGNTLLPGGRYWLRLSVPEHPEALCSVYAIHTQALKVTWQAREDASSHLERPLPAGTIKAPLKSIPGIGKIEQIVEGFNGRPREKAEHIKTSIPERLRHKNRATTPWDYERLILEAFPRIYKVKCFANTVSAPAPEQRRRPGHLLIVVVPQRAADDSETADPRVNGAVLKEIRDFVQKRASPFARLAVRNPAYERIQVRCTVKLKYPQRAGHDVEALNREISDYLSPWSDTGYRAGFGWCIRQYELEAFIRNRPYIDFVTNFSMLHIVQKGPDDYDLFDTAEPQGNAGRADAIRPTLPWSLPKPLKKHFIETVDRAGNINPQVTGIDELEIGGTLIITQR